MRRPTYSQVVSTLALFVALGGTAYAAGLPARSVGSTQLKARAVTATKIATGAVRARAVASDSLTGRQIAEATLGTVPRAADAALLGGQPPSRFLPTCPTGMAATHGLCVESDQRPTAGFMEALQTCAAAGRRLPTLGEAALAFEALGAPQPLQWASDLTWQESPVRLLGLLISADESRALAINPADVSIDVPFRCVASPTS